MWSRFLRGFAGDPRRVDLAASWLLRLAAGSICVSVGATWPLWLPRGDFPRVPFVGWCGQIPDWLSLAGLVGFGLAAVATTICGTQLRAGRWCALASVLAITLLVLADQQRLQPWVYQLVVLEILLMGLCAAESIVLARILVASIYFFSAVSKLDRSFFDAGGGQIVDGLVRCFGLTAPLGGDNRTLFPALVASGELLIAVGLCWRRSRKFAWPASIVMHLLLIAALSPWGAPSKPAVLLWNVYFILQNLILFGLAGEPLVSSSESRLLGAMPTGFSGHAGHAKDMPTQGRGYSALRWFVRGLAVFVILFPLTHPLGLCDVWPAWAVYATAPERLRIFVGPNDRDKFPESIRAHVQAPRFEDELCLVRIDRWSLDTCNAPLYPQNRFRLGVALAIADRSGLGESIVVEIDGPADRFTGKRTSRRLQGRSAIVAELERYWLNGFPDEHGHQPVPGHP
ncbi:MAG TPA: hypothetical protein VFG04_24435 [Planctomycetaceae bacterium]|nr:hypothetical protein [Planctomycetaceae bacterium]